MQTLANFIQGRYQEPVGGAYLDNVEPATGQVYGRIPDSDARDLELAVAAAEAALPAWKAMSIEARAKILYTIAEGIELRLDELAFAESVDNGKPVSLARSLDIPRAASNFRFFAQAITQYASEAHSMGEDGVNYTLRDPIGIVGCISPWNLPLYLFTWKIAPALAAGNCVIAKPSEVTPATAALLGEICTDAGLPAGVLAIVHGVGGRIGRALVEHPKVKAISFTGGTATGAEIARVAAPAFKKLSLELGGKNPTLVFADCAYEKTLDGVLRAAFANQGQICLCGSRIFVERPLYERFKADFVARAAARRLGDPLETATEHGALVSEAHLAKVLSYVELAKAEGGRVLTGGERVRPEGRCAEGYFLPPTVIEGLPFDCRVNQEEIFGPVATLMPFDSEEEVLGMANSVRYGLAASVWTENLSRAHRVAKRLEAGVVWLNCWLLRDLRTPFGGVKDSGVGREGGFEALRFFTEAKNVCIKY
ncbi:MAG: aldehyde dehydrogenase [Gammaproteobacteria bacterium]|nr:aldehyde dehydrogenase [Gammaproteobacteria bacterium]